MFQKRLPPFYPHAMAPTLRYGRSSPSARMRLAIPDLRERMASYHGRARSCRDLVTVGPLLSVSGFHGTFGPYRDGAAKRENPPDLRKRKAHITVGPCLGHGRAGSRRVSVTVGPKPAAKTPHCQFPPYRDAKTPLP